MNWRHKLAGVLFESSSQKLFHVRESLLLVSLRSTLIVLALAIGMSLDHAGAFVAVAPSVRVTGLDDRLYWVEGHGYNAATGRLFFTAEPSASNAPPPQKLYEASLEGLTHVSRSLQPDTSRDDVIGWLFSPAGDKIVYRESDHPAYGDLFLIDTAGGLPTQLTSSYGVPQSNGFAFIGDGERIVFLSRESGSSYELFSVATDGSEAPILLSAGHQYVQSSWELSPDRRQVYFQARTPERDFHYYIADTLGGSTTRLTQHPIARGLSRFNAVDGNYAYFSENEYGAYSLFIGAMGLSEEAEVRYGGDGFDPTKSYTMYGLAANKPVFRYAGGGEEALFIADPLTGMIEAIGDGNPESTFYLLGGISPRGDSVLFSETLSKDANSNRSTHGLFRYDVETGAVRELGQYSRAGCCLGPRVTYSPNGETFVVESGFQPTLFWADGTEIRTLDGTEVFYDDTGDWLFYRDFVDGTQQMFADPVFANNDRRQITNDDANDEILAPRLSSDGTVMTYLRGRSNSSGVPRVLYMVQLVPEPSGLASLVAASVMLAAWRRAHTR